MRHEVIPSTSSEPASVDDKVTCGICEVEVKKRYFANHLKSNRHKNNISKLHTTLKNVSVVETAFGNRIISYKIHSPIDEHGKNL